MLRWGPTCDHCTSLAPGVTCVAVLGVNPVLPSTLKAPHTPGSGRCPAHALGVFTLIDSGKSHIVWLFLSKFPNGVLQTQKQPVSGRVCGRAASKSSDHLPSITGQEDEEVRLTTNTLSQGRQEGQAAPLTTFPSWAWGWSLEERRKLRLISQGSLPLCLPRNLCQQRMAR